MKMKDVYYKVLISLRKKDDFDSDENQKLMHFCKYKLENGYAWIKGVNHKDVIWFIEDLEKNETYVKLNFKQWLAYRYR